jgi:hypothetical protein
MTLTAGKKKSQSFSAKAGLCLNVARNRKSRRRSRVSDAVGSKAPLFITGALEAICKHVLEKAFENTNETKSRVMSNRNVIAAVRQDPGLARLFGGFAFNSHALANKAVNHILPAKEQKDRQVRMEKSRQEAKERLEKIRAKKKAEKASAAEAPALDV